MGGSEGLTEFPKVFNRAGHEPQSGSCATFDIICFSFFHLVSSCFTFDIVSFSFSFFFISLVNQGPNSYEAKIAMAKDHVMFHVYYFAKSY